MNVRCNAVWPSSMSGVQAPTSMLLSSGGNSASHMMCLAQRPSQLLYCTSLASSFLSSNSYSWACTCIISHDPRHRSLIHGLHVQDHPYRYICDLRKGAADSLVEVEMAQKSADAPRSERMPEGLPFYEIRARMRELNVIVLARFLNETLRYTMLLLKMRPEPLAGAEALEQQPEAGNQPDVPKKKASLVGGMGCWHLLAAAL